MIPVRDSLARVGFACAALVSLLVGASTAFAVGINDTGQTQCYNAADAPVACSAAVGGDAGVNPRQDGRFGRDAQAAAGQLTKTGAGAAGFDYSKIANNGIPLAVDAALGTNPTDWACTKDNVTGLVWEVKTTSGLRNTEHTYTWYSTDEISNGGNAGALGTNTCAGSLAAAPYNNQCNTQNFVAAVNAVGLCGASDWRLPSQRELLSIVHAGNTTPSIDTAYFPNTYSSLHWTKTTYAADPAVVWFVDFYIGYTYTNFKTFGDFYVRLVRGGQ